MAPSSRTSHLDSDIDLLMFAIEHAVLILSVLFALGVVSPNPSEDRDTRVRAAIIATVLAGIGLASELMQWSLRIMLRIAGETADDLGLPRFITVCVVIIVGAPVVAGIAAAIPEKPRAAAGNVFTGCAGVAAIAFVVMLVGELWIING